MQMTIGQGVRLSSLGLFLACIWLWPTDAIAGSDYTVIPTGIKGGGCWYDDSHFIVVKGQQPAPGQGFEVEGLYYLDPNQPKDLRRIDLSPIEPTLQKQIRDVTCQDQTILFDIMAPDQKTSRLYNVKIGAQPRLVADMRWAKPAVISLRGQYVVGNKLTVDNGVWEEQADCDVKFLEPGLKAPCWPRDTIAQWLTPQFVVHQYLWRETILVREQDGNVKRIPNPKPPLRLADGTELKQGYLLRDLENRIVQEIPTKQGIYRIDEIKPNPRGSYLYATCSKAGDFDPPTTFFGRVCRLKLAESSGRWEEVFSVQKRPNERASLYAIDVNDVGDVVVMRRENRVTPTLWKYTARRRTAEQLPTPQPSQDIGAVQLSPDGQTISYVDKGHLVFLKAQGVKP